MNDQKDTDNNKNTDNNDDFREYWRKELHADGDRERAYGKAEQQAENQQYWNGYDDHGFRNTNDPNYGPIPEEYESNAMSRSAYACGIVSIICIFFSMFFFGGSFIIGALGILFALLSRRNKFNRQARHAIRMCVIGMGITVATVLLAIAIIMQSGMWGSFIKYLSEIDPNDPNSVTAAQQELMEDIMNRYGMSGAGLYGTITDSDTQSSEAPDSAGTAESDSTGSDTDGSESVGEKNSSAESFEYSGNGSDEII